MMQIIPIWEITINTAAHPPQIHEVYANSINEIYSWLSKLRIYPDPMRVIIQLKSE